MNSQLANVGVKEATRTAMLPVSWPVCELAWKWVIVGETAPAPSPFWLTSVTGPSALRKFASLELTGPLIT